MVEAVGGPAERQLQDHRAEGEHRQQEGGVRFGQPAAHPPDRDQRHGAELDGAEQHHREHHAGVGHEHAQGGQRRRRVLVADIRGRAQAPEDRRQADDHHPGGDGEGQQALQPGQAEDQRSERKTAGDAERIDRDDAPPADRRRGGDDPVFRGEEQHRPGKAEGQPQPGPVPEPVVERDRQHGRRHRQGRAREHGDGGGRGVQSDHRAAGAGALEHQAEQRVAHRHRDAEQGDRGDRGDLGAKRGETGPDRHRRPPQSASMKDLPSAWWTKGAERPVSTGPPPGPPSSAARRASTSASTTSVMKGRSSLRASARVSQSR